MEPSWPLEPLGFGGFRAAFKESAEIRTYHIGFKGLG